ncbi:MAG: tetratricopeptide repeat protein [Verrucomicrobiota bacterium]
MENPAPVPSPSTTNLSENPRYWFFISYSHSDLREASRIQRAIESFRIPTPLRSKSTRFPSLPQKPTPVFRDRDALASSHDLTAEIRSALSSSANLLVVCSRSAARSHWVAREIEAFLEIHGPESILCLVLDGEPNAADPLNECLPAPLLRKNSGRDILAADIRREADGRRQALLKILAGGLGLPYEALAQRERRRATRRAAVWIAASLLVALVFGALALQAEQNRRKAEREANRANLTSDYLTSVLLQFLPHESVGIPNAALLPLIDASASPKRLASLASEPLALIRIRNLLATAYLQLDQPKKALELYEYNLALAESVLGDENAITLECLFNVAGGSGATGNPDRAESLYRQLLEAIKKQPEKYREQRITIVGNLAALIGDRGRYQESADLLEQNLDTLNGFRPSQDIVLSYRSNYGNQLFHLGQIEKSEEILRDVANLYIKGYYPNHSQTIMAKQRLATVLIATGKTAEAERLFQEVLDPLAKYLGPQHPFTLGTAFKLVYLLHNMNRPEEGCVISAKYFGNPPDPELVKKGSRPGDLLPPCP